MSQAGLRVQVKGIVQGVGFRPFVYNLAQRLDLRGWVRNTSGGVELEVSGEADALQQMLQALREEAPPLAQIDSINAADHSPNGFTGFEIRHSQAMPGAFQPVSADLSICPDCLDDVRDPASRYYRYPFVNCTNCGPRFTIIRDLPYDRPLTTLADFAMCPDCSAEYQDPANRRYHAQPVSCPECGPHIWALVGRESIENQELALTCIRQLVAKGEVVAIKGLGGFHLACDASNPIAVNLLRTRKRRPDKPLAVMMPDVETVRRYCELSQAEEAELISNRRPILLLRKRPDTQIAEEVAPNQTTLGVMLPYTPLHYLLLEPASGIPEVWVMTSGNRSEEPIITENQKALDQLGEIASAFLLHNRPIQTRMDDSVMRVEVSSQTLSPIRRSRGYAPTPLRLAWQTRPILATGAELKNAFCLTREGYAFLSQHIGDLQNYETLQAFEEAIAHQEHLFRIHPELIAHDLHPDYLSTRYALERSEREGTPLVGVQHHHAHIVACMAENGLAADERVIGFSFDGSGYGSDGAIWGGEVLEAGYADFERAFHLQYVPLLGGDRAVREPWRMAFSWLNQIGYQWDQVFSDSQHVDSLAVLRHQVETGINAPLTSSVGRLFDAVAALSGLRGEVSYEGQAAIELENRVDTEETGAYPFAVNEHVFSAEPTLLAIMEDLSAKIPVGRIAARFHSGLADLVLRLAETMNERSGLTKVALSGGVWQNMTLLSAARRRLQNGGFTVLTHHKVPANDGGIALGQATVAHHRIHMEG